MVGPPQDREPGGTMGFKREMLRPSWAQVSMRGCGGVGSLGSLERGLVGSRTTVGFPASAPEDGAQEEGRLQKKGVNSLDAAALTFSSPQRNFQGEPRHPQEGRKERSMW